MFSTKSAPSDDPRIRQINVVATGLWPVYPLDLGGRHENGPQGRGYRARLDFQTALAERIDRQLTTC